MSTSIQLKDDIDGRIARLLAEIRAAEAKYARLRDSIYTRKATLNRLQAQLALHGEPGSVRPPHE